MSNDTFTGPAHTFGNYGITDGLVHSATLVEVTDRRTGSKTRFNGRLRQMEVVSIKCGANLGYSSAVADRHAVTCPNCM
jgi:hypothetical protein